MSSCEKCWRDSQRGGVGDSVALYHKLIRERKCSPEDQAGPDAESCPSCQRKTKHQETGELMCGCGDEFRD